MNFTETAPIARPNFEDPDGFYAELAAVVRELPEEQARRFMYAMVFCCANLVGKQADLSAAVSLARSVVEDGDAAP
jgi:hypothetical protein